MVGGHLLFPTELSSLVSLVSKTRTSLRSAEHGHAERTAPAGISRARARSRAKDAAYASNSRGRQALFVCSTRILFAARCAPAAILPQFERRSRDQQFSNKSALVRD